MKTTHPWQRCVGNRRRISTKWDKAWVRYRGDYARYNAILDHPRNALSRLYGTKHFVWKQHRVVAGERIGPVIAWPDIDAACTYLADTENANQFEAEIDEYLAERLNAPLEADYREFNQAYLAAKAELAARAERAARAKAERKRKRDENKVKREAEKLAKAERKRQREAAKLEKEAAKAAKKAKDDAKKPAASSAPQPAGPVRRSRRNAGKSAPEDQPGPEEKAPPENDGDANDGLVDLYDEYIGRTFAELLGQHPPRPGGGAAAGPGQARGARRRGGRGRRWGRKRGGPSVARLLALFLAAQF